MDDHMLETRQTPGKIEGPKKAEVNIPRIWNFVEREENLEFEVVQLEPKYNFLSLKADNIVRSKVDYFFDSEGEVRASRVRADKDRNLFVRLPGEFATKYTVLEEDDRLGFFFRDLKVVGEDHNDLEQVVYSKGEITSIYLSQLFRPPKENEILSMNSPFIGLIRKERLAGNDIKDWKIRWVNKNKHLKALSREKYNELRFADRSGKLAYVVNWQVEEGRIMLNQEYVKASELKTFSAPIKIDNQRAKDALFAEPPFGEETSRVGTKSLSVPWLTIPRIVGANLGYRQLAKTA